jgi:hypothetical protein
MAKHQHAAATFAPVASAVKAQDLTILVHASAPVVSMHEPAALPATE